MYQADSWEDLKDDTGNTLHIGKLEYKTTHGKKSDSFRANVFPRDVKSALCLVVNLFLEQTKVDDKDSKINDSLTLCSKNTIGYPTCDLPKLWREVKFISVLFFRGAFLYASLF
jgi:hypothetical protein